MKFLLGLASVVTVLASTSATAQISTMTPEGWMARYAEVWSDPEVESRIAAGIEQNRKGDLFLQIIDADGNPITGAVVEIEQTRHAFSFGANGFFVDGYDEPEKNKRWETAFAQLFNTTTVPFFWKDFEPTQGDQRISADSPEIFRRPPTERSLGFARRWGLNTKGHPLFWNQPDISLPSYWPEDPSAAQALIEARISSIGQQFGQSIPTWDVVNEVLHSSRRFPSQPGIPADYAFKTFAAADAAFPRQARLVLNEATPEAWDELSGEQTPLYLLAQGLIARGSRIDALGLQMHFFTIEEIEAALNGSAKSPQVLLEALDLYGGLGVPLDITEITLPTLAAYGGEEMQAAMTRNLYRLWFSHPAVEGITWWNLADGTAYGTEDQWRGGLLQAGTLEPKLSYRVLDELINNDWKTDLTLTSNEQGQARGRVFYGDYRISVSVGTCRWTTGLSRVSGGPSAVLLRPAC